MLKKYFASLQFAPFQVASETSANGDLLIFQNSRLKWFPKLKKSCFTKFKLKIQILRKVTFLQERAVALAL